MGLAYVFGRFLKKPKKPSSYDYEAEKIKIPSPEILDVSLKFNHKLSNPTYLKEKEKISLNVLINALETEYPTELITTENRQSYIYFISLLLKSKTKNKLTDRQYHNLMFIADLYGLKKNDVVF